MECQNDIGRYLTMSANERS